MKSRPSPKSKYRIRTAIAFFIIGWTLSAFYHGHIPQKAKAQELPIEIMGPPAPQKPIEVICTFEFPALPLDALRGNDE